MDFDQHCQVALVWMGVGVLEERDNVGRLVLELKEEVFGKRSL
jgi:hypothetical protein